MRQPEVARLAPAVRAVSFALAVVLVLPLLHFSRAAIVSAAFVVEFLSGGTVPALARVTPPPVRRPLLLPGVAVDLYTLSGVQPRTPLVLVHGLAPEGKDDPRLAHAAGLLARVGFEVAVPTIPGLTRLRLRPDDREPVVATLAARKAPTLVVGVSVGVGVALLATAEPALRDRVELVLSLGGYASARELVRFYLTGEYAYDGVRGHVAHDPELIRMFLAANADLLDASAQRVLGATDPAMVSNALESLSPGLARLLDTLSPVRVVDRIAARLILVHGRGDVAVPYSETLRLAAARPERTRVVLVGVVGHVEHAGSSVAWTQLVDMLRLWSVMYALATAA